MKRLSQSTSKLRDSNETDLADLIINMDTEEDSKLNGQPGGLGSVDSGNSDLSPTKFEKEKTPPPPTTTTTTAFDVGLNASDGRLTALDPGLTASGEASPNPKCSPESRLFLLSNYYKAVTPFLSRIDPLSSNSVNIRPGNNLPVKVVVATEWKKWDHFHYKMDSYPRGWALIVNNIEFYDKVIYPDRRGAFNDQIRVISLLKQFHFECEHFVNQTRSEMIQIVKRFSQKGELEKVDCAMIIFMSHGAEGASPEDTEIIGVDGLGVKTSEINQHFDNVNCPYLVNKPKVFFYQACRGGLPDPGTILPNRHPRTEIDGQKINSTNRPVLIRSASDMFIAYAVPPGRPANRDIFNGAWFIQAVIDIFAEHACNHDLDDLLKMVDKQIQKQNLADCSNFQTVTTVTIGWNKKLFFNPGLRLDEGRVKEEEAVVDHCTDSGAEREEENQEGDGSDCTFTTCLPKNRCTLC